MNNSYIYSEAHILTQEKDDMPPMTLDDMAKFAATLEDKKDHDLLVEVRVKLENMGEVQKDVEKRLRMHQRAIVSLYIIIAGLFGIGSFTKGMGVW